MGALADDRFGRHGAVERVCCRQQPYTGEVPDILASIDEKLASGNGAASFDLLIDGFLAEKEFGMAFEARLMKKRFELGLPLLQNDTPPDEVYQSAVIEAARQTGELFLEAGNIERAWPYFRAISDIAPVARAIEKLEPGENVDAAINIAFQEGVNPSKGLELILATHGMCRALTAFGMTAVTKDRDKCIALLTTALHAEIVQRIGGAIEKQEGALPVSGNLIEFMQDRAWLFGEWDYYVDTSHLYSVIPYCIEVVDRRVLQLMHELCEYGKHLNERFHSAGNPPFENQFEAYDHYVLALLGEVPEVHIKEHIDYFRQQVANSDPEIVGDAPGRFLVKLLISLNRPAEALDVLLEHVFEDAPYGVPVPSALQLCWQSKDFARMSEIARERGDLLNYTAAKLATL